MEEEKAKNPLVNTVIFVGILLILGVGIYFAVHTYQTAKEEKELTIEKVVERTDPDEMTYDSYLQYFADNGGKEPIVDFVYNYEIPEEERSEIDPLYNDPYVGYLYNEDVKASLFKLDDGLHFFLLYEPNSKEVFSQVEWVNDVELTLEIHELQGKKAELTKEGIEAASTRRAEIKKEVEQLNEKLVNKYEELNQSIENK